MIHCPICSDDSRVLHTDDEVRRRECVRCHHRFTTVEMLKDEQKRLEQIVEKAKVLADEIKEIA